MLDHTFDRADRLISPERVLTIVSRGHLEHADVRRQLLTRPWGTVIVQPENKDTGPGLLLPLAYLEARVPDAVVAVFPSDHFVVEKALFMGYVDFACRAVERDVSQVVLLGVEPEGPEADYGYVVPEDGGRREASGLRRVARFVEKPPRQLAELLIQQGALWNTMVFVFHVGAFFSLVQRVAPTLHAAFAEIRRAIGTPREQAVVEDVYRRLAPTNLSRDVLELAAGTPWASLVVAPMRGVVWSDWGCEDRIWQVLSQMGWRDRLRLGAGAPPEPPRPFVAVE